MANRNGTLTIIVDMQNDFVDGALANPSAQQIIQPMCRFIRESESRGEQVIFTLDSHNDYYLNTTEGKHLPIPHCIVGTEGHKVVSDLLNSSAYKYQVMKDSFGMSMNRWKEVVYEHFYDLADLTTIKLVGTCTDICVISNALILKALFPAAEVYVYADLCAGLTPERHQAALDVMQSCQINVENYFKEN